MLELGSARDLRDLIQLTDFRDLATDFSSREGRVAGILTPAGLTIPGDDTTTETISVGETRYESLDYSGDRDWFRLDLTAGQTVTISLSGQDHDTANGLDALADPYLQIFDDQGALLAWNDDYNGLDSLLDFTAGSTGTYFVEAGAYSFFDKGDYALSVQDPVIPVDYIAGDDTTTETIALYYDYRDESLETTGDRDWFRVDLDPLQTFMVYMSGWDHTAGNGLGALPDTLLRIRDAQGNVVARNNDFNGFADQSYVSFLSLQGGTYYVEAGAKDDLYVGDYSLYTEAFDGYFAGQINIDEFAAGTLEGWGADFYQVDLTAADTVWIGLAGRENDLANSIPALFSPYLTVLDAAGNVVAENGTHSAFHKTGMFFTADTTGAFYIKVAEYDAEYAWGWGDYVLRVKDAMDRDTRNAREAVDGANDTFLYAAGRGHNSFDGGAGQDMVDYTALSASEVAVVDLGGGDWTVTHLATGIVDELTGIETVIFADTVLSA